MIDRYIYKGILQISFDTDGNDEIMFKLFLSTSHSILDNNQTSFNKWFVNLN